VRDLHTEFVVGTSVVRAVDGVSFDVGRGQTVGIVGESGSGKSVTALSVMRLIPQPPGRITSGEVVLDGRVLTRLRESEMRKVRGNQIAMIFQDPMTALNPVFTVGRQVAEVLVVRKGVDRSRARKQVLELLAEVGIPAPEERVGNYPHQFSGGMAQRVMIAMALAFQPELLIADEPTTALDVTVQAQILDLLKTKVADREMSLILITHDLGVVAGMCSFTNVMYAGKIVERAKTEELFHRPRHPYTVGLLRSIPWIPERLGRGTAKELSSIPGQPPEPGAGGGGCPFAPRCFNAQDRCRSEAPPLETAPAAAPDHDIACWFPFEGESPISSRVVA
jgi:oligopeptide/dipeptide ABC transporter ATP-binding protein